ncbi:DNA adenine methylase [Glutamicibacter sp. TV12E]|uniref:DNA adenine methylase n=1 Tax=Glutamicibacter sp. TV12E TaxID=3446362 RepID=UPI00403362D7
MQYSGGKSRISKELSEVMLTLTDQREHYYEPFAGGGAVAEKMGNHFKEAHYSDLHQDLIIMWDAVVNQGWEPPKQVSEEEYYQLKDSAPSPARTFASFACSFGGKEWGGYARSKKTDYAATGRRSVLRGRAMAGAVSTTYTHASYEDLSPMPGDVIYCDPPYRDTTGYKTGAFDSPRFWAIAQAWAEAGASVYVSEYDAPEGWIAIWEKPVTISLVGGTKQGDKKNVEKLFIYNN